MRHAVAAPGAQRGAEQPAGWVAPSQCQAQRRLERDGEAVADVVLAVGGHRHVGGQHQGLETGGGDAVDQRLDARRLAGQIGLVPMRAGRPDFLQRNQRGGAEDHRDVGGRRGRAPARGRRDRRRARSCPSARCRTARHSGGRTAVVAWLRAPVSTSTRGTRLTCVEAGAVGAHGGAILHAAGDEAVQHAGQEFFPGAREIIQREIAAGCRGSPRFPHRGPHGTGADGSGRARR